MQKFVGLKNKKNNKEDNVIKAFFNQIVHLGELPVNYVIFKYQLT